MQDNESSVKDHYRDASMSLTNRIWDLALIIWIYLFYALPLPYAFQFILCGFCLVGFLYPRDQKLTFRSLNPVDFWKNVLATKSGVKRALFLLIVGILATLFHNIELLSTFAGSPKALQGFSMIWLTIPPASYLIAYSLNLAILRYAALRNGTNDKERTERKHQARINRSMCFFMAAFVFSALLISFIPNGPASWLAKWLVASGLDACLPEMNDYISTHINIYTWGTVTVKPEVNGFISFVQVSFFAIFTAMLLSPAILLARFLSTFVEEQLKGKDFSQAFISAWRLPGRSIPIRNRHALLASGLSTIGWLAVCYLAIFSLCGLSSGPLANAIIGWMDASVLSAGFKLKDITESVPVKGGQSVISRTFNHVNLETGGKPFSQSAGLDAKTLGRTSELKWIIPNIKDSKGTPLNGTLIYDRRRTVNDTPELRLFIASIIALYGTAPLAISACVFLPYRNRRRLLINNEGILLPGTIHRLLTPFRLWSDLKSIDFDANEKNNMDSTLCLQFFSGGQIKLKLGQVKPEDLDIFLASVDEFAQFCKISESVVELRKTLRNSCANTHIDEDFRSVAAASFSSTVFVPSDLGQTLAVNPDTEERLRVVRQLSSKPLQAVYLVRRESGELAIAKQFHLADESPEALSMRRYFEREYKVLSAISHPRIARVIDCYSQDNSSYLVLEYIRGTDLRQQIAKHGLQSEALVKQWAIQIAELLTYLHSQNPPILHRDLTPDNIVLAEDGKISLIDFGAAHQYLENLTGTMIGKKSYVAPEQLRGHAECSSDIYSFGATLYFLLTGKDPVALKQVCPPPELNLSKQMKELLVSCTAFDPADRPRSFQDILALLGKAQLKQDSTDSKEFALNINDPLAQEISLLVASNKENPEFDADCRITLDKLSAVVLSTEKIDFIKQDSLEEEESRLD